jgi:hypothetical protein
VHRARPGRRRHGFARGHRPLTRREGKTLGALASELLARALAEEETPSRSVTWHTQDMGDPAVDLDDKDALWAALDRP